MTGSPQWLTVLGIGEDGIAGLGDSAKAALSAAAFVFGGTRHLALAAPLIEGEAKAWPVPFDSSMRDVLARRGTAVVVLASGDPSWFGVATTLARLVPAGELRIIPAPSAFSLAAARMAWPLQDIDLVSLHGRPIDLIRPYLHPGRRLIVLTSDAEAPQAIGALLAESGFGPSRLTLLEALGGERERIRAATAGAFDLTGIDPLNVLAIEVLAGAAARVLTCAAGLPDEYFEHDGQITKREVRALTLSSLAPRKGELLWDIGAGSGSIAVEWMLADPSLSAIAIEADPTRAARIAANAGRCGVPGLRVVNGQAPAALTGLPPPDAVFIGGGGSNPGVMPAVINVLCPGGRLVANAVTLEMEAVLLDHHARLGGDLTRIAIDRAGPIGSMRGWRPAMPVSHWTWIKP